MKISIIIIAISLVIMVCLDPVSSTSSKKEDHRSKRAIGKWFSDFFKKFQKKERRRPMQFYSPPSMYPSSSYHQPSQQYGTPPMSQYGIPFEPHRPSYLHVTSSNDYGGGGSYDSGFDIVQDTHSAGYGGSGEGSFDHSSGYSGNTGGNQQNLQGFGPIKISDIIDVSSDSSYQPSSHHEGSIVISQEPNYYATPVNYYENDIIDHAIQGVGGQVNSNYHPPQDSYSAPSRPIVQNTYQPPLPLKSFDSSASYTPPSNNIPISGNQYQAPSNFNNLPHTSQQANVFRAPLASYSSFSGNTRQPTHSSQSQGIFPLLDGRQTDKNIFINGNTGAEVQSISELGPYDPIIEIVFQDGEPAPLPPPPVIDPSLYEPAKDDVEVYFIEYSPEDEYSDFKNLDLSGAERAVLQNLPNELPYELRAHLINSGVLENAEIEIVDLEHAIHDQSIDQNTRNALQAVYNRPNRDTSINFSNNQAVDIRVQRLSHASNTPEGIAEVISGLDKYRKGTFAGVVEINDKGTDKYIPVVIDGGRLPLPRNFPLGNKKVDGVLVLAPEQRDKRSKLWPKTNIKRGIQLRGPGLIDNTNAHILPQMQKRRVDISWADIDSNGWVPIVSS